MGICGSRSLDLTILETVRTVQNATALTDDAVLALGRQYHQANFSGTGYLIIEEFLEWLRVDEDDSRLARRFFEMYSDSGTGSTCAMSFGNFIAFIWNVCSRDEDSLTSLAFEMYDVKNNGALDLEDVRLLLLDTFGPRYEELAPVRALMDSIGQRLPSGAIVAAELTRLDWDVKLRNSPMLILPVFRLQSTLRSKTGGGRMWKRRVGERVEAVKSGKIDIKALVLHLNASRVSRVGALRRASLTQSMAAAREGGGRRGSLQSHGSSITPAATLFAERHFIVSIEDKVKREAQPVRRPRVPRDRALVAPGTEGGKEGEQVGGKEEGGKEGGTAGEGGQTVPQDMTPSPSSVSASTSEPSSSPPLPSDDPHAGKLLASLYRARDEYEGLGKGEGAPGWTGIVGPLFGWVKGDEKTKELLGRGAGGGGAGRGGKVAPEPQSDDTTSVPTTGAHDAIPSSDVSATRRTSLTLSPAGRVDTSLGTGTGTGIGIGGGSVAGGDGCHDHQVTAGSSIEFNMPANRRGSIRSSALARQNLQADLETALAMEAALLPPGVGEGGGVSNSSVEKRRASLALASLQPGAADVAGRTSSTSSNIGVGVGGAGGAGGEGEGITPNLALRAPRRGSMTSYATAPITPVINRRGSSAGTPLMPPPPIDTTLAASRRGSLSIATPMSPISPLSGVGGAATSRHDEHVSAVSPASTMGSPTSTVRMSYRRSSLGDASSIMAGAATRMRRASVAGR